MKRGVWPGIIAVSSIAIATLTLADLHSPIRIVFTLWFFAVCPGMAFTPLIRLTDRLVELSLGIALSLAIDTIVGGILVYVGAWSADVGLALLIAISAVGAVLQLAVLRSRAALPQGS